MLSDKQIQTGTAPPTGTREAGNALGNSINQPEPSSWKNRLIVGGLCLLAVIGVIWVVQKRRAAAAQQVAAMRQAPPPVPVGVGTVAQQDVPIYLDGLGTVQAFNTVTVHSRVDGQLKKVFFTEGQDVHAGDVLARIDPDPFQAALDQAIAKKGQDEAQLANARRDLKREVDLYAAKIDSQQVYDTQQSLVDQLAALVNADQAAIVSAQVQLDYTTINSPIDGRTGVRLVDQGNIVHAADLNGIVVITQLRPISVVFTLPEQELGEIHEQMAEQHSALKALALGRDNNTTLDEGTLAVIDNQINTNTGTIVVKATFPNEKLRLWPGQFVNVRLLLTTRKDGLVVPAPAIQRGPDGAYVFVIVRGGGGGPPAGRGGAPSGAAVDVTPAPGTPQRGTMSKGMRGGPPGSGGGEIATVKIQKVTVSPLVAGTEALVESGLQKGERIVVDGQYKLQDGSAVRITPSTKVVSAENSTDSIQ
jgi:multidrug efflux system membrane fusion protein